MVSRRVEIAPFVVRGEFHEAREDGRVRCLLCPRECTLREGQRAFCFVREARDGEVVLTSYGRSTGYCIDPIEKKPLNHFYPGTSVLSFGTAGCNLGCRFCQNWDISKARQVERLSEKAYPDQVADAAVRAGCTSVAFTYNDPVIFYEYASDTAQACAERGITTVAVTAGYVHPRARAAFFRHMSATNVDLKAFGERFYHKLCFAQLEPVLQTLHYIKHETNVWLEVTTLLIPGENDSDDEVARLCDWIARNLGTDVPLHFSAFHPDFKMLDKPRTPAATLTRARQQALQAGLRYVYTGNVHDTVGQGTYCPTCGALLIGRDWYELTTWALKNGTCGACDTPIPGFFRQRPGMGPNMEKEEHGRIWGPRRLPIKIGPQA